MTRLEKIKRHLSVTESAIITSLNASWIDYKVKDGKNGLYLFFSDNQKLDQAIKIISKKLKKHDFDYELTEYAIRENKWAVLHLWWEQIFFKIEKIPGILDKVKNIILDLFK